MHMRTGTPSFGLYLPVRLPVSFPDLIKRSATATNTLGIPLPENRPVENQRLILRVQIPPLPLPVDASTPDNPLNIQFAIENVTAVQHDLGRLAWKYLSPDILLGSERWQAITDLGNGKVLYESREVFRGALSPVVQALYEDGLKKGFEEQAQGLKLLLEGSS